MLICGAGIAGATLAYWLSEHGFSPTLIERAPALRTGGHIIDFWGAGFDVAERMRLLPQLSQAGYKVRAVRIVDESGRRIGGFGMNRFRRTLHDRFLSILRGDLATNIYGALGNRVETVFGDEIQALREDRDGVAVEFDRSPPRRFDLVIGADGLHSAVRRLTFGANAGSESYLGYCAAAIAVKDYPHRDKDVYVSYCRPGKQIARFALRDGRTVFFLIFSAPERPAFAHHDTGAQIALLSRVFGKGGWETSEILQAIERADDLYFDTVSQIRLPQWHRGRVALLGDAAFCPSLLAGQGAAFAMAGAYPRWRAAAGGRQFRHCLSRLPKPPATVHRAQTAASRRLRPPVRSLDTAGARDTQCGEPVVGRPLHRRFDDRQNVRRQIHAPGIWRNRIEAG